jgi:TonB family protein
MKKINLILITILLIANSTFAQKLVKKTASLKAEYLRNDQAEKPAFFKGGNEKLNEYLKLPINKIKLSSYTILSDVAVQIVIDEKGKVVKAKSFLKDIALNTKIQTIVLRMPNWVPASVKGGNVKVTNFIYLKYNKSLGYFECIEHVEDAFVVEPIKDAYVIESIPITIEPEENNKVTYNPEVKASFQGGELSRKNFIEVNLIYPQNSLEANIEGNVVVEFIVDKQGYILEPKIISSLDKYTDMEVIRLVKRMPKWIPGTMNGLPVSSYVRLPVNFSLQSFD